MSFGTKFAAFFGDPDAKQKIAEDKLRALREKELGIKSPKSLEQTRQQAFNYEAAQHKARQKAYEEEIAWKARYAPPPPRYSPPPPPSPAINANSTKRAKALITLGLPETATINEIKSKYRSLALLHHPNKGGNTENYKKIRQAYENLTQGGGKRTLRRKSRKNNTRRRSKL